MAKFNVGDVVRHKDGRGVVRGIQKIQTGEGLYFVDCFSFECNMGHIGESNFGHKFREIIPDNTGWWLWGNELAREECVVEYKGFHIGDRVETIDYDGQRDIGCTGTVVRIEPNYPFPICVRYDKKYAIRGGSDLRGILPQGSTSGSRESCGSLKIINHIIENEKREPIIEKKNDEPSCKYTDIEMRCIEKIKKLLTF